VLKRHLHLRSGDADREPRLSGNAINSRLILSTSAFTFNGSSGDVSTQAIFSDDYLESAGEISSGVNSSAFM
jgi:hypothetical protein